MVRIIRQTIFVPSAAKLQQIVETCKKNGKKVQGKQRNL